MPKIKLKREQINELVPKIQRYLLDELECDAGNFEVEFLVDFFIKQCGVTLYNQGLYDAVTSLEARLPLLTEAIEELEK